MESTLLPYTILLISYLLYLGLQSLFIVGIKLASLGSTETLPDGTVRDGEMLLYPIAKLLLKKAKCKIFYKHEELELLYDRISAAIPYEIEVDVTATYIYFTNPSQAETFRKIFLELIGRGAMPDGVYYAINECRVELWREYNEYVYSKWLRKPIIQCVVCMASFWGLFTFLLPMLIISHFNPIVIPAYLVNTVLLGAMNKIIYKKAE